MHLAETEGMTLYQIAAYFKPHWLIQLIALLLAFYFGWIRRDWLARMGWVCPICERLKAREKEREEL